MEMPDEAALLAQADAALRTVIDPEMGVNVVDLGLVRAVRLRGKILALSYQLTSPTCPIGGMMAAAMHDVLEALPGVLGVEMDLQEDPPWSIERMSPQGRKILGIS
jgi:metal-sulfur cluster biosynthetic enzyme